MHTSVHALWWLWCAFKSPLNDSMLLVCFLLQWKGDAGSSRLQVYFDHEPENPHWGWSWLERWMAARPWENRMLDHNNNGFCKEPESSASHHLLPPSLGSTPESLYEDSISIPPKAMKLSCNVNSVRGSALSSVRDMSSVNGSVRTSPTKSTTLHYKQLSHQRSSQPTQVFFNSLFVVSFLS